MSPEARKLSVSTVEPLCAELQTLCDVSMVRIGIDGMDGVGKTTLAKEIGRRLSMKIVSLDSHLNKKKNAFTQQIRCKEVQAELETSYNAVIEGVCLREVAELCGFKVDVHIYVRRISKYGSWHDEKICLAQLPVEELKEKERALREAFIEPGEQKSREVGHLGLQRVKRLYQLQN